MLRLTIFAVFAIAAQFPHLSTTLSFEPSEDNFTEDELDSQAADNVTTCGEVLSSSSGTIAYKQFQTLRPNERCVWVIRAPNATTYSVGIFNLGFPYSGPEHQLVVAGFSLRQPLYQFSPETNGLYNLQNTSVLVITFSTGPNVTQGSTGFLLQYNAYNTAQRNRYDYYNNYNSPYEGQYTYPAFTSRDVIVSGSRGNIKYPSHAQVYNNFELSTFVFGLDDNVFKPNSKISAKVIVSGLESCLDSIKLYSFNPNVDFGEYWELDGQICNNNRTTNLRSNDLFMLVFQSDNTQTNSGFRITYNYES